MVLLGEAYIGAGRTEEAFDCAERGLALSRQRGERGYEAWALRLLGEAFVHRDSPDAHAAAAHYRLALERAEELGMRPLVAHCHLGLGRLHLRNGDRDQAMEHLPRARTLYHEMGMSFWLPQVETSPSK
jgi:tetratricopeptide (TPR) repeat protein